MEASQPAVTPGNSWGAIKYEISMFHTRGEGPESSGGLVMGY